MMLSRCHLAPVFLLCLLTVTGSYGAQQRLTEPVPTLRSRVRETNPKAAAEVRKAQDAFNEGKLDKAVQHLRNVIALDPSNAGAYNDLGVIYYNNREFPKAIEAFGAMIEIDARSFSGYVNMAFVLNALQRYPEAERYARTAVDLKKMDLRARYLLGLSLAGQKKNLEEAMENLTAAAPEFPDAHLELSRILMDKGDFDRAMHELQAFTRDGKMAARSANQLLAK